MTTTVNRRQTFTIAKATKVDAVLLRVQYTGGGGSSVAIGKGSTVLATSYVYTWSGGLSEQDLQYDFLNSIYLEPGVYWIREMGGVNWSYMNSRVYTDGYYQAYDGATWINNTGASAYFKLYTRQQQLNFQLNGSSEDIVSEVFNKSLILDYAPLYLAETEDAGYSINLGLNMDSAKNVFAALLRQLPTGWFYHVDVGTGAVRVRNKNATPDHLLVFGRDFTEMKVTKDIAGIINDVYYVGGALVENGPKLTIRVTDIESIADYRQGMSIVSNDNVTRYDTSQLIAQNIVDNNNTPRLTTEITISAARYNTESVRSGDVVKIVNGDQDVLGATLVVATVKYNPNSVTLSLDSAPQNISRTIDAINRQLENIQTTNAGPVV